MRGHHGPVKKQDSPNPPPNSLDNARDIGNIPVAMPLKAWHAINRHLIAVTKIIETEIQKAKNIQGR